MMVVEELREIFEDSTCFGLLHVHLYTQQTLFAHLIQELIHHLQGIEVALLAELGAAEHADQSRHNPFQDMHWIGHQQSARGGACDDQQFRGLHKHSHVTLFHQEAADYRSEDYKNSYDGKHAYPLGASVT